MREGWSEIKLDDFAIINPRESIKKDSIAKKIAMDVLGTFQRSIDSYELEEFKGGTKFRNGDTLLARITPCLQNGKTAYVDILEDNEIAFGSTEYIVLREIKGVSDKLFIYYLSISPLLREVAMQSMTGSSGRQRIQNDVLKNYVFNLPPLPEQKAITHILGKLDDKIELNRQMNQTLEQMAQALFQSWFVDFDPVIDNALAAGNEIPEELQAKAEKRKSLLNSPPFQGGVPEGGGGSEKPVPEGGGGLKPLTHTNPELAALFPNKFIFDEVLNKWIPEGWGVKKVKELGKVVTGKTPSSKTPMHFGDVCPFVTPTDFKNYYKLVINADRKLSEEGIENNKNRILPIDTVVVTCIGSDMGKVVLSKVPCMTNQQINSMIPNKEKVTSEYLYLFFKSNYDLLRTLAFGGSTMPILNKTDFENIELLVPNKILLDNLNSIFVSNDNRILNNIKQTEILTQLRDVLLPQLISGKLAVPEAMLEVEKVLD